MAQEVNPRRACFSDAEIRKLIYLFSKKEDMLKSEFDSAREKGVGGNNRISHDTGEDHLTTILR